MLRLCLGLAKKLKKIFQIRLTSDNQIRLTTDNQIRVGGR